jgi:hypothetical protein
VCGYISNDTTSQTKNKIHNHTQTAALRRPPIWEDPVHGIILTLGNPKDLYKLIYTHFILLYFIFLYFNFTTILTKNYSETVNGTMPEDGKLLPKHVA